MVPAFARQLASPYRAGCRASFHASASVFAALFRHIRSISALHLSAPGGPLSSSDRTTIIIISTATETQHILEGVDRRLDCFQCNIRAFDGGISPRRNSACSSFLEQTTRCNTSSLVENIHASDLAIGWQE